MMISCFACGLSIDRSSGYANSTANTTSRSRWCFSLAFLLAVIQQAGA